MRRFELPTSSTPCWRDTGLRYIPNFNTMYCNRRLPTFPTTSRDAIPGYATSRTLILCIVTGGFRPSRLQSGRDTGLRYIPNFNTVYCNRRLPTFPTTSRDAIPGYATSQIFNTMYCNRRLPTFPTTVGTRYRATLHPEQLGHKYNQPGVFYKKTLLHIN
jgi:hypothetical protein